MIHVPGASGGVVEHAGTTQPLVHDAKGASAAVPVALLSDMSEPLTVRALFGEREQRELRARYYVQLSPRPQLAGLVMQDSSCSPWGVRVERGSCPPTRSCIGCMDSHRARYDMGRR